jgi:hypothetical protein
MFSSYNKTPSRERRGHTAPGQHVHSAQSPEEKKTFWISLSDSVSDSASLSVNVKQRQRLA